MRSADCIEQGPLQGQPGRHLLALSSSQFGPNAKCRHFRYVVAIAAGDLGELLRVSLPFSEIAVFKTIVAASWV
jgi:hypothetical protein